MGYPIPNFIEFWIIKSISKDERKSKEEVVCVTNNKVIFATPNYKAHFFFFFSFRIFIFKLKLKFTLLLFLKLN
jgi:hypothetical protein